MKGEPKIGMKVRLGTVVWIEPEERRSDKSDPHVDIKPKDGGQFIRRIWSEIKPVAEALAEAVGTEHKGKDIDALRDEWLAKGYGTLVLSRRRQPSKWDYTVSNPKGGSSSSSSETKNAEVLASALLARTSPDYAGDLYFVIIGQTDRKNADKVARAYLSNLAGKVVTEMADLFAEAAGEWGVFVWVDGATAYVPRDQYLKAYGRDKAVKVFKSEKAAEKHIAKHDPDSAKNWVVRQLQDSVEETADAQATLKKLEQQMARTTKPGARADLARRIGAIRFALASKASKTEGTSDVTTRLVALFSSSPGVSYTAPAAAQAIGVPDSEVRGPLASMTNAGMLRFEKGEGYSLNTEGKKGSLRIPSDLRPQAGLSSLDFRRGSRTTAMRIPKRAYECLALFGDGQVLTLEAVATALHMPASEALGLLGALATAGALRFGEGCGYACADLDAAIALVAEAGQGQTFGELAKGARFRLPDDVASAVLVKLGPTSYKVVSAEDEFARGLTIRNVKASEPVLPESVEDVDEGTFAQAADEVMKALSDSGDWTVSRTSAQGKPLKVPHATRGDVRLWFKAQAVYLSKGGPPFDMGSAHSITMSVKEYLGAGGYAQLMKDVDHFSESVGEVSELPDGFLFVHAYRFGPHKIQIMRAVGSGFSGGYAYIVDGGVPITGLKSKKIAMRDAEKSSEGMPWAGSRDEESVKESVEVWDTVDGWTVAHEGNSVLLTDPDGAEWEVDELQASPVDGDDVHLLAYNVSEDGDEDETISHEDVPQAVRIALRDMAEELVVNAEPEPEESVVSEARVSGWKIDDDGHSITLTDPEGAEWEIDEIELDRGGRRIVSLKAYNLEDETLWITSRDLPREVQVVLVKVYRAGLERDLPDESVDEAKKSAGVWRTTKGGHKIYIENGKVTKGNPHVVKKAAGPAKDPEHEKLDAAVKGSKLEGDDKSSLEFFADAFKSGDKKRLASAMRSMGSIARDAVPGSVWRKAGGISYKKESVDEKSPPGWKGSVKAMKRDQASGKMDRGINPFALAWSMHKKGAKPHYSNRAPFKKKDETVDVDALLDLVQDDVGAALCDLAEMAKLSARGRKEWLRVSIERDTPDGELTSWERSTRVYMSDGHVLAKRDVLFKPTTYDPKGRKHNWGWKDEGKVKAEYRTKAGLQSLRDKFVAKGWTVEADNTELMGVGEASGAVGGFFHGRQVPSRHGFSRGGPGGGPPLCSPHTLKGEGKKPRNLGRVGSIQDVRTESDDVEAAVTEVEKDPKAEYARLSGFSLTALQGVLRRLQYGGPKITDKEDAIAEVMSILFGDAWQRDVMEASNWRVPAKRHSPAAGYAEAKKHGYTDEAPSTQSSYCGNCDYGAAVGPKTACRMFEFWADTDGTCDEWAAQGTTESTTPLRVGRFYGVRTSASSTEDDFILFVTGTQANGTPKGVRYDVRSRKAIKASFNGYNLSSAHEIARADLDGGDRALIAKSLDGKKFDDFTETVEGTGNAAVALLRLRNPNVSPRIEQLARKHGGRLGAADNHVLPIHFDKDGDRADFLASIATQNQDRDGDGVPDAQESLEERTYRVTNKLPDGTYTSEFEATTSKAAKEGVKAALAKQRKVGQVKVEVWSDHEDDETGKARGWMRVLSLEPNESIDEAHGFTVTKVDDAHLLVTAAAGARESLRKWATAIEQAGATVTRLGVGRYRVALDGPLDGKFADRDVGETWPMGESVDETLEPLRPATVTRGVNQFVITFREAAFLASPRHYWTGAAWSAEDAEAKVFASRKDANAQLPKAKKAAVPYIEALKLSEGDELPDLPKDGEDEECVVAEASAKERKQQQWMATFDAELTKLAPELAQNSANWIDHARFHYGQGTAPKVAAERLVALKAKKESVDESLVVLGGLALAALVGLPVSKGVLAVVRSVKAALDAGKKTAAEKAWDTISKQDRAKVVAWAKKRASVRETRIPAADVGRFLAVAPQLNVSDSAPATFTDEGDLLVTLDADQATAVSDALGLVGVQ